MLYLKLTNPVTKIYQQGFTQTTVSGSYLVAQPSNYDLGSPRTTFYTKIGKMEFDESGSAVSFKKIMHDHVTLTSEELSNWGTDDFEALKAIAVHLELEIESSGSANSIPFTY